MEFKRNDSKVKQFVAGGVKETGLYACTITKCYQEKSKTSLSEAIAFEVVTDSGQIARFNLWVIGKEGTSVDRNGNELNAVSQINDLMIILGLEDMKSKPGKVMLYDFDQKKDVEQRKMIFHDVINKKIGILFEMRDNIYNGKTTNRPEFVGFYDSETSQNAHEVLNGLDAEAFERVIDRLSNKPTTNRAQTQQTAPQQTAPKQSSMSPPASDAFDDDDVPF